MSQKTGCNSGQINLMEQGGNRGFLVVNIGFKKNDQNRHKVNGEESQVKLVRCLLFMGLSQTP